MENPIEFSKRNRRAIMLFVVLIFILVFIPRIYSFFIVNEPLTLEQEEFQTKEFYKNKKVTTKKTYFKKFKKRQKFKTPVKAFNPNTYSQKEWMKIGLTEKQAFWVLKYAEKGFYSHEDLKKCFVISEELFSIIKDSLLYPIKPQKSYAIDINLNKKENIKKSKIEINSALEEDLLKIKGIGSFFAKNIIKRREALGGFVHKSQLLEVWKMDEQKLKDIEEFIQIDVQNVKKIPINSITVEELKKHPYFSWNIANSIVKLRQQIGGYQNVEDLKRSILVDDILFEKIKPYIEIK
ncbi:MAG: helix-hairpin-helix domain-containing protein [Flavobacteriia bacterium]|nr:helix-hairpin-helix domain-containing protein [Flavobacteriia bacterium]